MVTRAKVKRKAPRYVTIPDYRKSGETSGKFAGSSTSSRGCCPPPLSLSLSLETIVEGGRYREAAKRAADREGTAPRRGKEKRRGEELAVDEERA